MWGLRDGMFNGFGFWGILFVFDGGILVLEGVIGIKSFKFCFFVLIYFKMVWWGIVVWVVIWFGKYSEILIFSWRCVLMLDI